MILLLSLAGTLVVGTALTVATAVRVLRRRDHRCREQTRPTSCARCVAVLQATDRGGHMVCACGQASEHLVGVDLLHWRARHHGEALPTLPGDPKLGQRQDQGAVGAEPSPAGDKPPAAAGQPPVRSTTRGSAVAAAQEQARRALAEELSETQRRIVDRARRNPDPITPQLLREAEKFGARPPAPGETTEPVTEDVAAHRADSPTDPA